jgi:hypothetical protein
VEFLEEQVDQVEVDQVVLQDQVEVEQVVVDQV